MIYLESFIEVVARFWPLVLLIVVGGGAVLANYWLYRNRKKEGTLPKGALTGTAATILENTSAEYVGGMVGMASGAEFAKNRPILARILLVAVALLACGLLVYYFSL